MKGTKRVTACQGCLTAWDEGAEPACVDPSHTRSGHLVHVHEDEVRLPDGTMVVAASHDERYERDVVPSFGLYLDARWSPPWRHEHVAWPDFGLPADVPRFRRQLDDLLRRSRSGQPVEVGCAGGHGRTGTLLGCAVVLSGGDPGSAVEWVRSAYCEGAVETPEQERFVRTFTVE